MAIAPVEGIAQSAKKVPRVGLIYNAVPVDLVDSFPGHLAFYGELTKLGWVPGRNIEIVWRTLEGDPSRIPGILDELLRREVDVIVLGSNYIAGEAQKKSHSVAIVTLGAVDPVGSGLATALGHPGANVTGVISQPDNQIDAKRIAFFRETLPGLRRMAYFDWDHPAADTPLLRERSAAFERTAHQLGITLIRYRISRPEQMEAALADAKRRHADGAYLSSAGIFSNSRAQGLIKAYAEKQRMPVMHTMLSGVEAGGLIAYDTDLNGHYALGARFVDRILKGAKPGDIPFEQVGNFLLYVNKNAAKAIGLTIPASILMQADKVIE